MSTQSSPDLQVKRLTEGAFLFISPQGNILFGCPPEILKRILSSHLPMPDTVVVPEKMHHYQSSQSSLEFPLYHFLFVQRGLERERRFQVIAKGDQCRGLAELLRVTVVGPNEQEMLAAGCPALLAEELYQETTFMALKNPATGGNPYTIPEMINFLPLEAGQTCEVYPVADGLPAVLMERTGPATFRVLYGEEAFDIDMTVTAVQEPSYKLKQRPLDRSADKFTLTVLGRSNGFDPNDPANGYVLNIGGKIVLWDCPAYLHQHLSALKLDPHDIDVFVLSHVHEDHIDVAESLRDPPFEMYTTPEIHYSLLVKLAAVYGCSLDEARRYHNYHPIDMNNPVMEIAGARMTFFHSVHAIPALGVRVEKVVAGRRGVLHISGDHLSNETLGAMHTNKGISDRRMEQMGNLLNGDETLVLMDAGGGAIHGDYRDYLDYPGRVAYMHTGLIQEELPGGKQLLTSGQVLDVLE